MARARLNSGDVQKEELPKAKLNKHSLKNTGKLLRYLHPYRYRFMFGMVFLFLSSVMILAFPAILGGMIDAAQHTRHSKWLPISITSIASCAFLLLLAQALLSFFRIRFFVEVAERTLADLRKATFFKLITLPMDFFNNRRVGELNSRISADLTQIQETMTTTLAEAVRQVILLIGGIVYLCFVSGKLTLLNLSILPVLIVTAVFFGRYIRNLSRRVQDQLADSNSVIQETLQGISNVKAFVNESFEADRYQNSLTKVVNLALKSATYRGIFASFIIFCIFGAVVAVVWYGSTLISQGQLTVGNLTTYIIASLFVAGSMGSFPELYANIQKSVGASERVIEILAEEQENVSIIEADNRIEETLKGSLQFQHVSFCYPSRKEITVLNEVSFTAEAGEKVAIVGPSGAGKSTLASLILRFYDPQSGAILFDGKDARDFKLTDIRHQVAIVPQDVLLFGGSIRDNIGYGKLHAHPEDVIEAAKRANAHQFIMGFPQGYDTLVGERGVKLSGGQRQRIAIARALLKDPAILLLDEATSSLDSESERLVQEALEELMKNRTSIIIAHRLSTIKEVDKIVVIEAGKVTEVGTHQELLRHENGLYRYLTHLQSANS